MRKTIRELQNIKSADALVDLRDQVAAGTLCIRQMTAEERLRYPPQPRRPKPKRPTRPVIHV
jgi:hypothetical protein